MVNTDFKNKTSLVKFLSRGHFIIGNEQYWNIVDGDGKRVIDHDFSSLMEMNKWAEEQIKKEEDELAAKNGKSKPGGLQLGLL